MRKFEELKEKVEDWAEEKTLQELKNVNKQFMKFIEEVFELKTELDKLIDEGNSLSDEYAENGEIYTDDYYYTILENVEMEMGDVLVTLIVMGKQLDIDLIKCLEMAYGKIKDRKGITVDGVFIKEEDLGF